MAFRRGIVCVLILTLVTPAAVAATTVPSGNRNAEQPPIPGASARRTGAAKTTFEAKYQRVHRLLKNDRSLRAKIRESATQYKIDPIHIIGAIVGEHTYNVDAYDQLQTYYVKAVSYLRSSFTFSFEGEPLDDFIQRLQFAPCAKFTESYSLWSCRETIWDNSFRGKTVEGKSFPKDRFSAVFLQPFFAGQTFGIGQLNPLTALQLTDMVHRISGHERIDHRDPQQVYRAIMDPDVSLDYVAAMIRKSIDAYSEIADFDISKNPGLTATLYNLGNPETRAKKLAAQNRLRSQQGLEPKLPEENYYGWLVNDKLEELEALAGES